jgi:hypothetical protein
MSIRLVVNIGLASTPSSTEVHAEPTLVFDVCILRDENMSLLHNQQVIFLVDE